MSVGATLSALETVSNNFLPDSFRKKDLSLRISMGKTERKRARSSRSHYEGEFLIIQPASPAWLLAPGSWRDLRTNESDGGGELRHSGSGGAGAVRMGKSRNKHRTFSTGTSVDSDKELNTLPGKYQLASL